MKINLKGTGKYLRFPIQTDKKPIRIILDDGNKKIDLFVCLAEERIDYWKDYYFDRESQQKAITMHIDVDTEKDSKRFINAVRLTDECETSDWSRPVFHFSCMGGYLGEIKELTYHKEWKMTYLCNPFGLNASSTKLETAKGDSLYAMDISEQEPKSMSSSGDREIGCYSELIGDICETYLFPVDGTDILIGRSRDFLYGKNRYRQVYTIPFQRIKADKCVGIVAAQGLQKQRIWKREWHVTAPFLETLSFRIIPSKWPNICIAPPDGGTGDITAKAFEIQISFRDTSAWKIETVAAGISFTWDRHTGMLQSGEYRIFAGKGNNLEVTVLSDYGCGEILCNGQAIFLIKRDCDNEHYFSVDNEISGNLEKCRLMEKQTANISIISENEENVCADITVYGIRSGTYSWEAKRQIGQVMPDEKIIYKSENFSIYKYHVSDSQYGAPDAWAVSPTLVYSPVRVTEEFAWRDTPWGDMVRSIDRGECFRPDIRIQSYASIYTGLPVLDAAYNIAIDTFVKCKSKRFALEGQAGLWSAGLFQGEKESFGVWLRDSAHIALRGGNLIDPEAAGKTLLYALYNGFDNGSDGCAMAACGIWDYYMVTRDCMVIFQAWEALKKKIEEADILYVESENLVKAYQSTSNDSLQEPENNGYCLSTECYYMMAYESMYRMGCIIGEKNSALAHWKKRADAMKKAIRDKYWNEKFGYFTSGPKGSEAYEKGMWETSGVEAAIWERFGIATDEQRHLVLKNLEQTAMCEYGIVLFPHKEKINHFCGSVWTVWEAGFASAAADCNDTDLIWKLIAQQIRNCIINKTFYEVIDKEDGKAWRWSGQLWHAAGFLSLLLYGLLGIKYSEEGLYFNPCIPKQLPSVTLNNLKYGRAVFQVRTEGNGSGFALYLDGTACDKIMGDIEGTHEILLKKTN